MLHRVACVAGRVHAATGRGHDHRFAACQADRAFFGVFEGAAHLRNAVNPCLELGRDAEVVQRRANHDHVSGQKLRYQRFRHGVFALLDFAQFSACGQAKTQRFGGQMAGRVHGQIQIADFGGRVGGAPRGDDLHGELAGNRVAAEDAGINVEKLGHGAFLEKWLNPAGSGLAAGT